MITRSFIFFFFTGLLCADTPEQAVEKAHAELWRRFVDEHNLILDYVGLKGEIARPTPEDCRELKPSALSWGVPNEDGPMFNGLYLDAACNRWLITRKDEDRAKARRLIDGLIKVSTIGKTQGFIARGIATDGRTTYPMGSNDHREGLPARAMLRCVGGHALSGSRAGDAAPRRHREGDHALRCQPRLSEPVLSIGVCLVADEMDEAAVARARHRLRQPRHARSRAAAEALRLDAGALEHLNEEIAQRHIVLGVEGEVLAVFEAAASEE